MLGGVEGTLILERLGEFISDELAALGFDLVVEDRLLESVTRLAIVFHTLSALSDLSSKAKEGGASER